MQLHSASFAAMGTACTLHLHAESAACAGEATAAAMAEVRRLERRYSRYRADSVVSGINAVAAAGGSIAVDEETGCLLDYAIACYRKSGGLFDITSGLLRRAWDFRTPRIPAQEELDALLPLIGLDKVSWRPPLLEFTVPGVEIDLGGIVKEYAADRAAEVCGELGLAHGIVELGGDVRVLGPHSDGAPWQIGICHPRRRGEAIATVSLMQGGLATSGDYERYFESGGRRYCHLLNPRTGWPVQGLSAVSVVAESCLVAGSVASIGLLMERAGIDWLADLPIDHLWIDEGQRTGGRSGAVAEFCLGATERELTGWG